MNLLDTHQVIYRKQFGFRKKHSTIHALHTAVTQIVQGLMAITAIAVNGLSPVHVSELSPEYANAMGIQSTLTPSRANGFLNMFKRVQEEAIKLS